jgi:hypothetical protein
MKRSCWASGAIWLASLLAAAPAAAHQCWNCGGCGHHCGGAACDGCRGCAGGRWSGQPAEIETVAGRIAEINYLPGPNPENALVELRLDSGAKAITVQVAPAPFLARNGMSLKQGEDLSVRGYRAAGMEGEVFVAVEIEKAGRSLVLRTGRGRPAWW